MGRSLLLLYLLNHAVMFIKGAFSDCKSLYHGIFSNESMSHFLFQKFTRPACRQIQLLFRVNCYYTVNHHFCYCIHAVHWFRLLVKKFNKHSSNCMIYTLWWSQIHLVKMQRETRAKTEDDARREFLKAIRVCRRRQRIEFITYHLPSNTMHFNLHLNLSTNG